MTSPMTMGRHEFLAKLHELLRPRIYFEIGVQHGWSLNLAAYSQIAIGIDPNPLVSAVQNQSLYHTTSDEYFANKRTKVEMNMAFIDGMHLAEYALRDFINVAQHASPDAVIVFDDVLPRNHGEAARVQCPGDWTGDVWKVHTVLKGIQGLDLYLVDTAPTGTMIVFSSVGLLEEVGREMQGRYMQLEADMLSLGEKVPTEVLYRTRAIDPMNALAIVSKFQESAQEAVMGTG